MSEIATVDPPGPSTPRRQVLAWLARGFLSLWGLGFVWVTGSFIKPPRSRRSLTQRVIELGALDALPVGQAMMVRHGRDPIFVVREDESTLLGLSASARTCVAF